MDSRRSPEATLSHYARAMHVTVTRLHDAVEQVLDSLPKQLLIDQRQRRRRAVDLIQLFVGQSAHRRSFARRRVCDQAIHPATLASAASRR